MFRLEILGRVLKSCSYADSLVLILIVCTHCTHCTQLWAESFVEFTFTLNIEEAEAGTKDFYEMKYLKAFLKYKLK